MIKWMAVIGIATDLKGFVMAYSRAVTHRINVLCAKVNTALEQANSDMRVNPFRGVGVWHLGKHHKDTMVPTSFDLFSGNTNEIVRHLEGMLTALTLVGEQKTITKLEVCTDCHHAFHSGENYEGARPEPWSVVENMSAITDWSFKEECELNCFKTGDKCDCHAPHFSISPCDGCGSGLAGNRYTYADHS